MASRTRVADSERGHSIKPLIDHLARRHSGIVEDLRQQFAVLQPVTNRFRYCWSVGCRSAGAARGIFRE
jgi:hypothetical protein